MYTQHQIAKYKDIHKNQVCYIFGSGPSVNKFKMREPGVIIGCNHIIKLKWIRNQVKYYFFGDGYLKYGTWNRNNPPYFNHQHDVNTLGNHVDKFCMVSRNQKLIHGFTPALIKKLTQINALSCDLTVNGFFKDISTEPFMNHSIVFPAVQFALYAGFTKIYLVGCDCDGVYHTNGFNTQNTTSEINKVLLETWKKLKIWKNTEYPHSKIVSLNPVGLIGIMDEDINS